MSYLKRIEHVDLNQFNHGVGEYAMSHKSVDQYAYDVMTGKVKVGYHAKNCVARYIYDRVFRSDLEFRTEEIDDLCTFAGCLRHVKGPMTGMPIELMNWMVFCLGNIFGWYYSNGAKRGQRRFTKAFIMVARGNAKSFMCSIVSLWTQVTSPNGSPECYSVARTEKQATVVFEDALKMLKSADPIIRRWFKPSTSQMDCLYHDGVFQAWTSDAQTLDGHRITLGIADELHAHRSADLLNTLISGTSAVSDPIVFSITTAGKQLDGVCVSERNIVRAINEDFEHEDSYWGIEYAIDKDDAWDDPSCWYKANPSLGASVTMDELLNNLVRARSNPVNRVDFQTKRCNLFVNTNDNPYIDLLVLQEKCSRKDLDIKRYIGKQCWLGLDLAQKTDLTSLAFIFAEDDGSVTGFIRNYIPEGAIENVSEGRQQMYAEWEDSGHLIVTPGFSTDYAFIERDIRWAAKTFDLQQVGFDPYSGTQLALGLIKDNIELVEVRQGYSSMSEPAKLLQSLVLSGRYNYQETDKVFEWAMANAVCTADLNDNIKVHKAKDKPLDKVDPVVALITGLALAKLKEPKQQTPYRKRGLLVV